MAKPRHPVKEGVRAMNRLIVLVLLATLAAAVLLAGGCGPTPTPTLPGESLEWERISQQNGGVSGYQYQGTPKVEIITDAQEAAILDGQVYPGTLSKITDADFSAYFVIAIFQGYKGCANYSVEGTDVRREGNVITVYAKFLTPDPKDVQQPITTSPYCVLRIKKTPTLSGDFVFALVANNEEIMRQPHTIP